MTDGAPATLTVRGRTIAIRLFEVTVVDGPDRGKRAVSRGDELTIGTSPGNDLQLTDPGVSRHHCAIRTTERGLELRDLASTNGTLLGESEVVRVVLRGPARLRLGSTLVAVELLDREIDQPLADDHRFGDLIGASPAMRRLYPLIQRCAESTATVLIEGETGTGKELVAESIHRASTRRHGRFAVVDCGALPRTLIESELFGHVRGAFTGADTDRTGALVAASGGTVLLDEIGELPLALQPVLLRALENRTVRPVGSTRNVPIDVRVLAATHRDLRVEVNRKRFRADLYYRLHVLRIEIPPLRQRAGDIAVLCEHFWRALRPDAEPPSELVADLVAQAWPGNVRELRNAVERAAASVAPALGEPGEPGAAQSYAEAKQRAIEDWERGWIAQLVAAHRGNLSRAARAARMGRSHLRQLARRYDATDGGPDGGADGSGGPDAADAPEPTAATEVSATDPGAAVGCALTADDPS
jgi:transcriptional regulator of acetoin/glycerol metabolism